MAALKGKTKVGLRARRQASPKAQAGHVIVPDRSLLDVAGRNRGGLTVENVDRPAYRTAREDSNGL